jgi:molecular chaperone HscB
MAVNYFQLFGLTPEFSLDVNQLSQHYQQLQKTVHPDRFAHASNQEQLLAVQKSALINDAYQTLKHPLRRAEYLLTERGTELANEQVTFADNQFLMRQMELRELLAEIAQQDDHDAALFHASELLDSEYQQLFLMLEQQLASNNETQNHAAGATLRKLKFYQKLQHELERIEEQLFED